MGRQKNRKREMTDHVARIELRDVTKRFGQVTAVNHFSLRIDTGEFLTLLGPSGCGKTTVLRMIAGLEVPDQGEIRINGEKVFSSAEGIFVPPAKRVLAWCSSRTPCGPI